MKNNFLLNLQWGGVALLLFFSTPINLVSQNNIIELGVSYDQEFVDNFSSEQVAKDHIVDLFFYVNCIYSGLSNNVTNAGFEIVAFRKISTNGQNNSAYNRRLRATAFWYYQQDVCNKVDAAIHITGTDLQGVDGQASGSVCNVTLNGGVAIAEFQGIEADNKNAQIIAHELGHMLITSSHESESFCSVNKGLMCDYPSDYFCEDYILSEDFKILYENKLTASNCLDVKNTNVIDPNCPNCSDFVVITNDGTLENNVEFGCSPSINDFNISTSIANKCDSQRDFMIDILYNSNYIEFIDIDSDFTPSSYSGSSTYNSKLSLPISQLDKGQGDISMGHVKVKGSGIIGSQNNGTQVNILYSISPESKIRNPNEPINGGFIPQTQKSILYQFLFNHQIDKTNDLHVKASELVHPYVDSDNTPLNFCTNIKYDIYLNGIFEIDIDQNYCNTNFYLGPNAKVIVNSGKTLSLKNCMLSACESENKWQGVEVAIGGNLILDKTILKKAITGINCSSASSTLSIVNQSLITQCNTGVNLFNTTLYPLSNSFFSQNDIAIKLTKCPITSSDKCTFTRNGIGINAESTYLISTSDFTGTNVQKGIVHNGEGHELFIPSGSFEGMQSGVISNNCKLQIGTTNARTLFKNNFIGVYKGFSPMLAHKIVFSSFEGNDYGVLISQNSNGLKSYITGYNVFNQNKYAISITNTQSPADNGWEISGNEFKVAHIGIKSTRSDYVDIWDNNFESSPAGRGYALKDMIALEGGIKNKIRENTMIHQTSIDESEQMRNIYVANAANTQVHCNILNNGTYGLNVWGAAPSLISANTMQGSHTGLYYGLYPNNGNVATGVQTHHGNIWENNPPFSSSLGAKHLSQDGFEIAQSRYIVDEQENPKFNTSFSAVTNWITNQNDPANSSNCANPPLSGTSGNAGGSSGLGGGTMALSISNGDVPFTDFIVPLNQSLDQQLYTSILNGDNQGLNTNQISTYTSSISSSSIGILAQANYLMSLPINGSSQVTFYSDQIHALMELYYTGETTNDPNASLYRSQINTLSSSLSTAYQTYLTQLLNRIDQVQHNISPLLVSSDSYIYAQANVMQLNLKQLKGDSLNLGDITKLTQIANSCPLAYGDAVYGARSILSSLTFTDPIYDDHQLCQQSTPRSIQNIGSSHSIYPNPTHSVINVSNTMMVVQATLFDNTERIVLKINNTNNLSELSLSVENLSPGVYYLKLDNQDKSYSIHKIIVIK